MNIPPAILGGHELTARFGGVCALNGVSLDVRAGEVHAVVGENGTGKSTLMRILAGHLRPDSGEVHVRGHPVHFRSPHDALELGVTMIPQEPAGFPDLSVAENVALGSEPGGPWGWVSRRRQRETADRLFARLGVALDATRALRSLTLAEQQTVGIARALAHEARVVIMDEPTSAISDVEARSLHALIREIRHAGVGVLYISHRLDEVLLLADRVTVLRDGRWVTTEASSGLDARGLVALMAGREVRSRSAPPESCGAETVLEVLRLARPPAFEDISFHVRRGEVVGMAGLLGSGRSAVANALYGLEPAGRGEIRLLGKSVRLGSPGVALARGVAMVTEDRRTSGIIPRLSLQHNVTLASLRRWCAGLWIREAAEQRIVGEQMTRLGIKADGPGQPIAQLSGGNQQKALLARALLTRPRLLILDEPTRGIDVAAKGEIHDLIRDLAGQGLGVLVISSELPELMALSHRILVMRQGRMVAEFDGKTASADAILEQAMPR